MIQSIGTPVRVTSNGVALATQCNLAAFTITAKGGDVNVTFRDGSVTGTILWEAEADASSGSHSLAFTTPIPFPNGLYIVADVPNFLQSVCVNLS